jgi:hypothetical protein
VVAAAARRPRPAPAPPAGPRAFEARTRSALTLRDARRRAQLSPHPVTGPEPDVDELLADEILAAAGYRDRSAPAAAALAAVVLAEARTRTRRLLGNARPDNVTRVGEQLVDAVLAAAGYGALADRGAVLEQAVKDGQRAMRDTLGDERGALD